ncbi:MAG: methyltransferase domain-containing protein [bacterium]|nr:methyltransferase domain-containing protein [bacterium]
MAGPPADRRRAGLPRLVALDALVACLEDRISLDRALERDRRFGLLEARDRALVHTVTTETCRRLGQIDALIAASLERPLSARARNVRAILRLGIAQLLFLGFAPHAAIDSSVRLAHARAKGMAPLVNAVLRRLQREGRTMIAGQDPSMLNTPSWLYRSWRDAWGGATASAIARVNLERPELDVTVVDDAETWAARLGGRVLSTGSIRVPSAGVVRDLSGYECGRWWVQDTAASFPARLLGDISGRRVLDLCAAPGGKTAQLALAGARVTAVDVSGKRMERLQGNMERLGCTIETRIADAATWRSPTPFDAVLLDAPCSGTGTIRRHPDIPWTRNQTDVRRLASLQRRMIANALANLSGQGVLVYAACSIELEEGEAHLNHLGHGCCIDAIHPDEVPGLEEAVTGEGCLRVLPTHLAREGGLDGFFVMRLRQSGEAGTSIV